MKKIATVMAAALVISAVAARADQGAMAAAPEAMAAAAKADYLMLYDEVAKKIQDLGAAIPEGKYDWRPAQGVRSVGEVLKHIDGATYLFAKVTGAALPADAPKDPEKGPDVKSKQEILAHLAKSLAYGRSNAEAVKPAELEKKVDFFGNQMSVRAIYMAAYGHMSEHLGQLIAYARSVGVVPPWSK